MRPPAGFRTPAATIGVAVFAVVAMAQPSSAPFSLWAASHAHVLTSFALSDDLADLQGLAPLMAGARVVALGEPSHANEEPLAFRNRLFRFLVEEQGFTAIALESGLVESRGVQAFVDGGPGDVADIVGRHLTWGFGRFEQNVALVQWMRDYNADPRHQRKLHFYGLDISLGGPLESTPSPTPLDAVLDDLATVDLEAASTLKARFAPWRKRLLEEAPAAFSAADHDAITAIIDATAALMTRERQTFEAHRSRAEYDWVRRMLESARQADRGFRGPVLAAGQGIPPDAWRGMEAKDAFMAANVRWALAREGRDGRLLVFAHNTHVHNARTAGGPWARLDRPPAGMGLFLRQALGEAVRIIGTSGARSQSDGPDMTLDPASIDAALAGTGLPSFFVDLRSAQSERSVAQWLRGVHSLRSGGTYQAVAPYPAFDALLFIEKLTRAAGAPPR